MSDIQINKSVETPLIEGNPSFGAITEKISSVTETWRVPNPPIWFLILLASLSALALLAGSIGWLFWKGIGVWGVQIPNAWGWAIINFVFWVGIGHAGTLISAILFLFRQKWRTSINRAAEAMTILPLCVLSYSLASTSVGSGLLIG